MNKNEFFNKIKEAERYYNKNNPCYHCGPGNGCDDCRGCKDGEISNKMWRDVNNLKNEYKEKFNADYDNEVEALDKAYREKIRKEKLLKEVWETCTFDEIIDAGFEHNKCSGAQLINAAAEFDAPENNEEDFIDKLKKLCEETPKQDLPWGHQVMDVITDYFYDSGLLDYFDNDDLIDYLDGSCEMDAFIKEKTKEVFEEFEDEYTFKDFQRDVEELPNWKLKRFLCDLVMANYHISDNELAQKIIEKIK